ncbi:lipocalin family protein [Chitinophaga japonensis]|uniref:Lipocalin-like protein n=1 Tax=Chitinophaga japonensis TaxID=104662 RepID=A0A562TF36_CHIJA|nr:lipocalin family protein [Chitinophaga japonensis]TWI91884.1 lipocalin-like protein [Chitinophaga japonensis]
MKLKNLTLAALCLVASLLAVSCSTPSGATSQSISKSNVTGNWVVTDIQFEGIPENSKVTVFDEASYNCFKGSNWVLPSNGKGSYTLSATSDGCTTASQPIMWSLNKQAGYTMFQFKKLTQGIKAKDITDGYRVELSSVSGDNMVWRAPVTFENQSAFIVYTLQKTR